MIRNFRELLGEKHFHVTIFGSARIKKNDPNYKMIYSLAEMLGERGIDVVSGGGPGIMAAAGIGHSQGRKKSGLESHTIGLGIRMPHEQKYNKGISVSKTFKRFSNRLDNFMLLSNVVVVAPGGIGTLLELFYTWQLMQVKHTCNIPIILLGDSWKGLVEWLEKEPLKKGFFEQQDMHLIFHARNAKEAVKMIDDAYIEYIKGNKDFCLNYRKYKLVKD